MIDGSEKGNRQLAFELQNLHVCEKHCKWTAEMKSHLPLNLVLQCINFTVNL